MAYDTTEAVAKFLSGFQMKITNRFVHDLYNSPELCAAPRYVEQSFGCPSEEYEKEEGTLPHDFTIGKWRVHLI